MKLTDQLRNRFDDELAAVLDDLPPHVTKLFDEIPLVVEDYPSDKMLADLGLRRADALRGLHTGVPLTKRSVRFSGVLPTVITIYRLGIYTASTGEHGRILVDVLRREIRKTVLHELGHFFGMNEEDLRRLGYG